MKLCGFNVGLDQPFFLIAGPCVIESEQLQMDTAGTLKEITSSFGIPFIFKSSYDKANRSSGSTFRGPGMEKGLESWPRSSVVARAHPDRCAHRSRHPCRGCHRRRFANPRLLMSSNRLHSRRGPIGQAVNIKKGQFLAPHDMKNVIDKARAAAEKPACLKTTSWPASAEQALATTIWCLTCAAWSSCAKRALQWSLTPPIRFNCLAVKAPVLAACVKWCPCCHVRLWLLVWQACSWKHTPTQHKRCRMDRMPCPCSTCEHC